MYHRLYIIFFRLYIIYHVVHYIYHYIYTMCPSGGSELVRSTRVTGVQLASNNVSWPPFCLVLSALAALSEPIWPPRCPSELQNGLRSSNLASVQLIWPPTCPPVALPMALRTFKKCGRVIKNQGFCLLGSWSVLGLSFFGSSGLLGCLFGSTWSSWRPLGLNLEPLGCLLGCSWSVSAASWA